MNSRLRLPILVLGAIAGGLIAGEILSRSFFLRDMLGRLAGRGRLVTIANGHGVYETDLGEGNNAQRARELITRQNLERAANNEPIPTERVDREVALLAAQFGDGKAFRRTLQAHGLTESLLRERVINQLRVLAWLEKQLVVGSDVNEAECREFYEANSDLFLQPVRYCAAHIFLAAHAETPPDVVEEKEVTIAALAQRLQQGEVLAQVAVELSEDEMTKARGGDLGFFAETRMPADFMAEVEKLQVDEISKPFRTHLGFHIAHLSEVRESRLLSFEEARPGIWLLLANQRRAARVDYLAGRLTVSASSSSN